MSLIRYSPSSRRELGHTILELLVALGLTLTVCGLIATGLRFNSEMYQTDIRRMRIQQNLRSALDIMSMNIRQTGEGLDELFPALLLSQSGSPASSVLRVRRKIQHEVLQLCANAPLGNTYVFVSDDNATDTNCLPANVAASLAAWTATRTAQGGQLRIFMYNRVAKVGEFLTYYGQSIQSGDDFLQVTPLHTAAISNVGEMIKLLSKYGANPNIQDNAGSNYYYY
jgi:Tfp pilus assembly protein PilW